MHKPASSSRKTTLETSNDLARIVRLNEEIKMIVTTAFRVNLMALNAIFLAKRAGRAALGFGVLSNELRVFAQDLTRQMVELKRLTADSVEMVTKLLVRKRNNKLIAQMVLRVEADSGSPPGRSRMQHHVQRGNDEFQRLRQELRIVDRKAQQAFSEIARSVELGGVLARSAKIEAAYGGGFSAPLMQVSSDFSEIINRIKQSLDLLARERIVEHTR